MTSATLSAGMQPFRRLRAASQARWDAATPRQRAAVQATVVIAAIAGAYSYSLSTLLQDAGLETPLAYVSLVPVIALALAAARSRPNRAEPPIHDRQLDYIVGLPLIGAALAINYFLPAHLSAMFWVWRVDLLSLPLFAAGVVAIVFGVRVLWRQKLAVGYLILAWPLPYTAVLLRMLDGFTTVTLKALNFVVGVIPVAKVVPAAGGELFNVTHAGKAFSLSVISACSGVNGMVGFLLIGSAFGAVVRGPRLRKSLWLLGGMVLLWILNIGRLVLIFAAGSVWGEHVAIDILHPYIGLVDFAAGVLLMIVVMPRFGLSFFQLPGRVAGLPPASEAPGDHWALSAAHPGGAVAAMPAVRAVPRVFGAVAIVAASGIALGVNNVGLSTYNLVADAAGHAKLPSFAAHPGAPTGWKAYYADTFTWAKPYFGDQSNWVRFDFRPLRGKSTDISTGGLPITADVIDTPNLSSFSAYGVEACYQFHGYQLRGESQVPLGGGIEGQTLSFQTAGGIDWSVVYWIMPVVGPAATTRYERVVLYYLDSPFSRIKTSGLGAITVSNDAFGLGALSGRLTLERNLLVTFARQVVNAQAHGGSNIGYAQVPHRVE